MKNDPPLSPFEPLRGLAHDSLISTSAAQGELPLGYVRKFRDGHQVKKSREGWLNSLQRTFGNVAKDVGQELGI